MIVHVRRHSRRRPKRESVVFRASELKDISREAKVLGAFDKKIAILRGQSPRGKKTIIKSAKGL